MVVAGWGHLFSPFLSILICSMPIPAASASIHAWDRSIRSGCFSRFPIVFLCTLSSFASCGCVIFSSARICFKSYCLTCIFSPPFSLIKGILPHLNVHCKRFKAIFINYFSRRLQKRDRCRRQQCQCGHMGSGHPACAQCEN